MAENRFKKSIVNATDNTKESILDNEVDNITNHAKENIAYTASNSILEKVLKNDNKGKGGNHTLYLSADVGEAVVKYAKKAKKSKSTLVDEILREVLVNNQ